MALITPDTVVNVDMNSIKELPNLAGDLVAGEALLAGAPCRIGSDGLVYMSNATAADANANAAGWTVKAYAAGQVVTLYVGAGIRFHYAASGLTPGAILYTGATAGRLDDAATTGDAVGIATVISATDIITLGPRLVA